MKETVKNLIKNRRILNGLNELSKSLSLKAPKKDKNYFSKFKVKTKEAKIKTNLKSVKLVDKYARFLNRKEKYDHPANAYGMDSSLSGDSGGAIAGGFGIDTFGITAFGESINKTKSQYLSFINNIAESENYKNNDIISTVIAGYKVLFDSMENNTTAIICGIQPSMASSFNFSLSKLVLAINTFTGSIVSLYLGGTEEVESLEDIKDWYASIGISDEVINKMVFVEKSNPISEASSLNYTLTPAPDGINSHDTLLHFCDLVDSAIIVGCVDSYFIGELMLGYATIQKHVDIDTNFIFSV